MIEEIPLSLVVDNPFNSRKQYDQQGVEQLSESLRQSGLLNPIGVRKNAGKYEIIFGHRQIRAARLLHWKDIRADVSDVSDEQMLQISLVENLQRENLSDFEKAICFTDNGIATL
ncbi:MAG: ParB/RepB/Spo0J family partition protein, partial [Nitrososphaerales archaeon]